MDTSFQADSTDESGDHCSPIIDSTNIEVIGVAKFDIIHTC